MKYLDNNKFKEGDIIYFDMPPMCSGEYSSKVKKDNIGLFVEEEFFDSCYGYRLNKPYWSEEYQDKK